MSRNRVIRFGRYRLDPAQGLRRGVREVRVTPKSLSVLTVLAERSGQVVTKTELFTAVWPDTAVSDAALTSCVQELRHALDDDARRPRIIETVHRRGFRFLVPVQLECGDADREAPDATPLVGRTQALQGLMAALDRASSGTRQVVLVTGEAGIGKTALVDAFRRGLDGTPNLRALRADCVERYTAGEAFQPLLEALTRHCRQPGGGGLLAALRKCAPTWLAQLPALHSPAALRALERRTAGVTRERMLRELNDCLDAGALDTTLVLWIDDLHWSDASTLDWLASFAQRPERARVLVIATSRRGVSQPVDDFGAMLDVRGRGVEIALSGLDIDATRELVMRRFRSLTDPDARELARQLHAHTEGHPLFMSLLLDDLESRGVLAGPLRPAAGREITVADGGIPETLRRLIGRQFEQLDAGERWLLEAASVLGGEWSCATAAACTQRDLDEVESSLLGLSQRNAFVRRAGSGAWPDGTVAEHFAFVHALHREVLHDRLPARRRAELHRLAGERLEAAFREGATDISAQLAVHFEEARHVGKAVAYLTHAGRTASRRGAPDEARKHFSKAIALLESAPPSAARDESEVDLQILLGGVTMAAQGWGAAQAERAYDRARDLCARLDATPRLFPSLWGLWLFRWGRGDLAAAQDVAATLERLACDADDRHRRVQSCHALWATAFSMGDLDAARAHADRGLALNDTAQPAEHGLLYGNHDAGVCGRLFAARALAIQGRFADAVRVSDDAIAHARRIDHSFTLALALVFGAAVHQLRRDPQTTARHAGEAVALSARDGFRLMRAWAAALEGWADAEAGSMESAITVIPQAVEAATATGSRQFHTFLLSLVAEAHLKHGRTELGLAAIEQARAAVEATGERFCEAEIHRLRGELLLGSRRRARSEAESALHLALETARRQHAHLFTLRAAISLARLWQDQGRADESRRLVTLACRDLPEGVDAPDIDDARAIITGGEDR